MSETLSLGQSIIEAREFLQRVHKDVYTLVVSLDAAMAEKKWEPPRKTRVRISHDLGNSLSFDKWLIAGIWRLYVPHDSVAKTSTVLSVHIDLEPVDLYDEPICVLAAAHYPSPRACMDVWDGWEDEAVEVYLADKPEFQTLTAEYLQGIFPKAVDGRAKVIKLCRIDGDRAVREHIVDPLLQAAKALRP